MESHHSYGVCSTDRPCRRTGRDPRVILQGPDTHVGHDCHQGQYPYQEHAAEGILVTVQLVIHEAVADVAVVVNGNASDTEY